MANIRTLEFDDLTAVATLLRANLPGWDRDEAFLASTLLQPRWTDCEPPSLVAVADGSVVGFMGAQARPLLFDGADLLGVCVSQLAVAPTHRAGATGALLIRRLLSGDQDLTWVDNATDLVTRIWRIFGGTVDAARAVDWMLVLRPARWTTGLITQMARERTVRRLSAPVPAIPFQAVGPRLLGRAFPAESADISSTDATPAEIVDLMPTINERMRLRVAYREQDLEQQLTQIGRVAGRVACRVVRYKGDPVGWYAFLPRDREASRVLHLSALENHLDDALTGLISHAREAGCIALSGRVEPHLMLALRDRFAALGFGVQPLHHSREPEVRAALSLSSSLLTELDNVDSSWW